VVSDNEVNEAPPENKLAPEKIKNQPLPPPVADKRDSSESWSSSEEKNKKPKIEIVIKDKPTGKMDEDIQRAMEESTIDIVKQKSLKEQEDRELEMALQLSLADKK